MKKYILHLFIVTLVTFSCKENPVSTGDTVNNESLKFRKEIFEAGVRIVYTVAISNSENKIAWGGLKHDIKVKGGLSLEGHIGVINSLEFSKNGNLLLSGSGDHNIKIWDANSGELLKTFSQHLTVTRDAIFTPDGKSVVSAEDNHIVYWSNAAIGNMGKILFLGHSGNIYSIDIDRDNQIVISGSNDKTIKIWDASTGNEIKTLEAHSGAVYDVEFNPIKNQFASCSADSSIIIWDSESYEIINTLKIQDGIPKTICYHPSGNYLAYGGSDSQIYILDLNTYSRVIILNGHTSSISKVKFSHDGSKLISGGFDDKVIIWHNVFANQDNE